MPRSPWFLSLLAGTLLGGAPLAAAPIDLRLENAAPADVESALEVALGADVEVRGGKGRQVTLNLSAPNPPRVLDRVAAALGGSWKLKLRVRAGRPEQPAASPVIDRQIALGLQDVSAARA